MKRFQKDLLSKNINYSLLSPWHDNLGDKFIDDENEYTSRRQF